MHHHPDYVDLPVLRQLKPSWSAARIKVKFTRKTNTCRQLPDSALMNWTGL
jgi:hypothetical protein